MTEIRSTIDLMMERTSGMRLSEEERQRIKREELEKKASGYALKLIDPNGPNQSALSSLDQESPEERSVLETLVWKNIVQGISSEDDIKVFLKDSMTGLCSGPKEIK